MSVDAGTVYSSIRIRLEQLDQDLKGVYSRLDSLESQITQKMDKSTKAVTASFDVMSLAGAAAFLGIGKAIKTTISTYASFSQSMSNVAAVSNATGAELQSLTDAAKNAGATTKYTASQAADALFNLTQAGMSAEQATQALSGVLSLAQASGAGLAESAESMSASLSQFGLKASDSARVANVFAAAANTSLASMEKLTSGLRQVGPVAGTLGISIEEVTANLDALFNKGFQGEQAGTALRSILLDLVDPSSAVVAALEKQGVTYDKVNPKIVGLSGAFENMQKAGVDLTTVFGKVSSAEALALIDTAGKATGNLRDMQKEITGTNSAADAAAKMNDNLNGSLLTMQSQAEAASISFGETFSPALRGAVTVIGELFAWIAKLPAPLLAVAGGIAVASTAIGGLAAAFRILGIAASGALGPIGIAIGVITTVAGIAGTALYKQKNVTVDLNKETEALMTTTTSYKDAQNKLNDKTKNLTDTEKTLLENRKSLLKLKLQEQLNDLVKTYDSVNKKIDTQNNKVKYTQETIDKYNNGLKSLVSRLTAQGASQEQINKAVKDYTSLNGGAYAAAQKKNLSYSESINKAQTDQLSTINALAQGVSDGIIDISNLAITNKNLYDSVMAAASAIKNQSAGIEGTGAAAAAATSEIFDWKAAIKSALGLDTKTFNTGAQAVTQYTANLRSSLENAIAVAKKNGKSVSDVYKDYADDVDKAIKSLLESGGYKENEATIQSLEKLRDEFRGNFDTASYDEVIEKQNKLIAATKEGSDAVERLNVQMEHPTWSTEQTDEYIDKLHELNRAQSETIDWQNEWKDAAKSTTTSLLSAVESASSQLITSMQEVASGEKTLSEAASDVWAAYASSALSSIATVVEGIAAKLAVQAGELVIDAISAAAHYDYATAATAAAGAAAAAGKSVAAFASAGAIKGLASNMATGGIVEPSGSGTLVNVAENGSGEVMFNTGPSGQAFIDQMGAALSKYSGNSGTVVIKLDSKVLATAVTRRQKNKDY